MVKPIEDESAKSKKIAVTITWKNIKEQSRKFVRSIQPEQTAIYLQDAKAVKISFAAHLHQDCSFAHEMN